MPVLRDMKTSPETLGYTAGGHETVTADQFRRFVGGLTLYGDDTFSRKHGYPEVYGWTPNYPSAEFYWHGGSIVEEALYRSNFAAIREHFEEVLGLTLASGTSDTFEIPAHNTHALALACRLDLDAENYPLFDEMRCSELETALVLEGIESYFRDDVFRAIEEAEEYRAIFGEEAGRLDIYTALALEEFVTALAREQVAWSGELYIYELPLDHTYSCIGAALWPEEIRLDIAEMRRAHLEETQTVLFEEDK